MGKLKFWWKVVNFVAPNTVYKVVSAPIKASLETIDKGSRTKVEKYKSTQHFHTRLILEPNLYSRTEYYNAYDEDRRLKYTVKGKFFSLKHYLRIYDAQGIEMAKIKEELVTLSLPTTPRFLRAKFKISVAGKKLGKIKLKRFHLKTVYLVKFKKWKIVSDFVGLKYDVYKGDKVIMMVTRTVAVGENGILYVDIFEEELELMGLIIGVVVDSISVSKGERLSSVRSKLMQPI